MLPCTTFLTPSRVGAVATGLLLSFASPSLAAPTKEKVCGDVARKAQRTLWDSVRKSADETFCRKPWTERTPAEFAACALADQGIRFSNRLKNTWNAFFANAGASWATWGPRGLGPNPEYGTIRGGFKRTFFGAGIAYSQSKIEVTKRGGKAEGIITVCTLDYNGRVTGAYRRTFKNGKQNVGSKKTVTITHSNTRIVGVVVDTPPSINKFEYKVQLKTNPTRNLLGPVSGMADLHVHQMANIAFGGRFYWGHYTGPKSTALTPEQLTGLWNPVPSSNYLFTPPLNIANLTFGNGLGIDANIVMAMVSAQETDEGFFQLGGGGDPYYRDWPHHADRSHQQVHTSWLKAAHDAGLNLVVVSVVNNDILCSVTRFVDPYGNVAVRNSSGQAVAWSSSNWGCSDHENVLRQLEAIHEVERNNSWYRIAMNPWHARQIIEDGDLAIIVSLETDKVLSSEGGNYGDYITQLDEYRALGVTTLQIVHESNSRFCGAAVHRNMMEILQAIHWPIASLGNFIRNLPDRGTSFNKDHRGYNQLGLTSTGRHLLHAMVARNMPIDLAHGSERCRLDIFQYAPSGYAYYDSHTKFERLLKPAPGQVNYGQHVLDREEEFVITRGLEDDYAVNNVLIGLRTASVDVYSAPNPRVANSCPGSARSFAQQVQFAHDRGYQFAFGTDFNTGVAQLGPRFGPDRCYAAQSQLNNRTLRPVSSYEGTRPRHQANIDGRNYYDDGLAHIGLLPELVHDLKALQTPGASQFDRSAEAYLTMWQRAWP